VVVVLRDPELCEVSGLCSFGTSSLFPCPAAWAPLLARDGTAREPWPRGGGKSSSVGCRLLQ